MFVSSVAQITIWRTKEVVERVLGGMNFTIMRYECFDAANITTPKTGEGRALVSVGKKTAVVIIIVVN